MVHEIICLGIGIKNEKANLPKWENLIYNVISVKFSMFLFYNIDMIYLNYDQLLPMQTFNCIYSELKHFK